jgi:protein-tyrosine phosphatase
MDLFPIEIAVPGHLVVALRPRGGDWLADDLADLRRAAVDVLVTTLTPEEERELELVDEEALATVAGLELIRLAIPDRAVPGVRESLGTLARIASHMQNERRVAVHCRQGIGRSTMVAASVLVLLGVDAEDAWNAVGNARGRPVPDTPEQRSWVAELQRVAKSHPSVVATSGKIDNARAWLDAATANTARGDQSLLTFGVGAGHRATNALEAKRFDDALAWGHLAVRAYNHFSAINGGEPREVTSFG